MISVADKISSLDQGYATGDLSLYPEALDDKEVLYEVSNNAKTTLKQTLPYNGKIIIVEDTTGFPAKGQLRLGTGPDGDGVYELVIYGKKTTNTFQELKRGFAGSRQNVWNAKKTYVTISVSAEAHNAVKDAVINMQANLGVKTSPSETSLNGILIKQETRFLAPKPLFRAFPIKGPPSLKVRFQNFATGHIVRYLWDFGDGGTSLERNPTHLYVTEGRYTVKLNVITSTGAQGVATKTEYIEVNSDESIPFAYIESVTSPYSIKTAAELTLQGDPTNPKEFVFVDQTDGDVVQRNWVFGDGEKEIQEDANIHETSHIYSKPGEYLVTLLVVFSNGRLKKVELPLLEVL